MKITNEQNNILLNRREINLLIEHNGIAPKKEAILNDISKHFKTENNLITIKGIYPSFGKHELDVIAYVYDSLDIMNKIECVKKKVKKNGKEKSKKQKA